MKKQNKIYIILFILFIFSIFSIALPSYALASDPKLISTLNSAFEKLEKYIIRISTPAAAVAVCTGLLMKKFSFGDEEKIRTAKRLIRGSLFSYGFILCVDLVLSLIETLLK